MGTSNTSTYSVDTWIVCGRHAAVSHVSVVRRVWGTVDHNPARCKCSLRWRPWSRSDCANGDANGNERLSGNMSVHANERWKVRQNWADHWHQLGWTAYWGFRMVCLDRSLSCWHELREVWHDGDGNGCGWQTCVVRLMNDFDKAKSGRTDGLWKHNSGGTTIEWRNRQVKFCKGYTNPGQIWQKNMVLPSNVSRLDSKGFPNPCRRRV